MDRAGIGVPRHLKLQSARKGADGHVYRAVDIQHLAHGIKISAVCGYVLITRFRVDGNAVVNNGGGARFVVPAYLADACRVAHVTERNVGRGIDQQRADSPKTLTLKIDRYRSGVSFGRGDRGSRQYAKKQRKNGKYRQKYTSFFHKDLLSLLVDFLFYLLFQIMLQSAVTCCLDLFIITFFALAFNAQIKDMAE